MTRRADGSAEPRQTGDGRVGRREFLVGTASLALGVGVGLGACSDDSNQPSDGPVTSDGSRPVDGTRPDGGSPDGASSCPSIPQPLSSISTPSRVVEVHDAKSVTGSTTIDETRVHAMLVAGLTALAKQTDIKQAWKALLPDFSSSMRIGLKVNCLSSYLYNSKAFLKALIKTLVEDLGADAQRLVVWDRRGDELERSGLTQTALGVPVMGTVKSTEDASGPGYETQAECALDVPVHLSRILTEQTDLTINLPLVKTHTVSGMTGALKNTYGCIDNPGELHDDLNHRLPALYRLDRLRQRMRLHISEALIGVIKGDTADPPDSVPARLLLSSDPVALDSHSLALINKLRDKLPNLPSDKLVWLDEAARLNLGTRTEDAQVIEQP